MRFSFNWLKRYLSTDLNIQQIADKLTSIGLEVESVQDPTEVFKKFKLVQIKKAEKHPDADKLQVCVVVDADGNEMLIVCGAKNARVGLKTVLATPGAVIPATNDILKKSKIRGIPSEGMMCSFHELALPSKEDGIIELDPNINLETSVGDALNYEGGIIDVSVTPNRGDCFSVKGIARDLASAGAGKFIVSEPKSVKGTFKCPIKIDYMKSDACSQYAPVIAFRVIRGIKNGDSPDWLKNELQIAGLNSISLVIDLANWLMVDTGRPFHVYDAKKIDGKMSIRFAHDKEVFEDIKKNSHVLRQDMLVSADEKGPLCLLGVMGGLRAACTQETTDILIESGLFDPIFVSGTGTFLNITSDARTRFERGIDKNSCVPGIELVTKFIIENCGGEASDICVVGSDRREEQLVTLNKVKLNSISGYDVNWQTARTILKKLGLKEIESTEESITLSVPSWREDLNIEEDLIEEVLRINGYDNISEQKIDTTVIVEDSALKKKLSTLRMIRQLVSRGLSEVVTYSFTKQSFAEAFKENKKLIHLINPISADLSVMRPSLIPNLLLAATRSLNYGRQEVEICEVGNVFCDACEQELHVAGLRAGVAHERNWLQEIRPVDVFDAKADALAVLAASGINERNITVERSAPTYFHPSRSGTILHGKKKLGYFGELHPRINKLFGITERIVCFELFAYLLDVNEKKPFYRGKVFPKISRDFAFVFDSRTMVGGLPLAICKLDARIEKADIFDCFDIGPTKKSIGLAVTLGAIDRTLTEEEAQEISDKLIAYVKGAGGELRTK